MPWGSRLRSALRPAGISTCARAAGYASDGTAVDPILTVLPLTAEAPEPQFPALLASEQLPDAAVPGLLVFVMRFRDDAGTGLDDNWEIRYFGEAGVAEATGDPDGDCLSNLLELFLGGNPTVPGSVPHTRARDQPDAEPRDIPVRFVVRTG